jgi:hypothetical protein
VKLEEKVLTYLEVIMKAETLEKAKFEARLAINLIKSKAGK